MGGMEQIQLGKHDVMFCGSGELENWGSTIMFDGMGALSSKYNDDPTHASRAFDKDRDGFVIAAGGGVVIVEELEHAKARGAKIYAELVGYSATSDGYDMVAPSGELGAIKDLFTEEFDYIPNIGSTKSLSGHALSVAGVHEAIYSLLMMDRGFLAESANIVNLVDEAEGLPILTERKEGPVSRVMSNSFGFGGTNACLVFDKYEG